MIIDSQHIKPGKGAAFCRAKMRNLKNNNVLEQTFRGDEKLEEAYIEERKLQYQYSSGDMYHFMDNDNYEDVVIAKESIADKIKFLKDNIEVNAYYYKIIHTEQGVKGDTAKSGTKPATIDTGATVQVPLFIDTGDSIKVDTRTGSYIERVSR
jgi:elongation factor P